MVTTYVLALCLVGLSCALPVVDNDEPLPTVPEVDVAKYVGRWYQVYGNRLGWFGYGAEAVCISADYTAINSSAVTVLNANRVATGDGEFKSINGTAFQVDPVNEPGKLIVRLFNVPFDGDYWIVMLGAPTFMVGDKAYYQWAVVSGPARNVLYILARDTEAFYGSQDEAMILEFLDREGFTRYENRPIKIAHPDDCIYPPTTFM